MRRLLTAKKRLQVSFLAVVAASVAGLALLGWQINTTRSLTVQGQQAHDGLCALKADLARRVDAGYQYLHDHPEGIPGIPVKTIQQSLANQQATLNALQALDC